MFYRFLTVFLEDFIDFKGPKNDYSKIFSQLIKLGFTEGIVKKLQFIYDGNKSNQVEINGIGHLSALHPSVQKVATALFEDGHFRQAILDTYIMLVNEVKLKSNLKLDNSPLMQSAFSAKNPVLKISNDNDEQLGFMWLFSGAVMGIRNPKAHRLIQQNDRQRTLEWLSFASVLFRILDEAENVVEG